MQNLTKSRTPKVIASILFALCGAVALTGCAVNPQTGQLGVDTKIFNRESVGSIGGGLLGAAVCNQLFKGHGSKEGWTAACGLGGYFLSRSFIQKSNGVLERNRTGQTSTWTDPDGRRVSMTPQQTYYSNNLPCRKYETEIVVDGRPEIATGTACRRADGSWKING